MELLSIVSDLLHYLKPEVIIDMAGPYVLVILCLIIFAETGLMIGFFLPGDSLLVIVGIFTATGVIPYHILLTLALLTAAAIVGDQTGYLIGRKVGIALFNRPNSRFFKPQYIAKTKDFYDRHGGKAIMLGRFVPVVRTFVPMVAGVARLEYRKFVFFNVVGGIVWINSMTLLGYVPVVLLGKEITEKYIRPNIGYLTIAIILISAIPIVTTFISERRRAKKMMQP